MSTQSATRRTELVARRWVMPLLLALGCEQIKEDKSVSQGGISPDPSAVLEGSVLYIGPHPTCLYKPDGITVDHVVGRVVMTIFEYTNPPPPEGEATTASNLFFLESDKLFETADCLPPGALPNFADRITRSAAFVWSQVPLDVSRALDYQIRGFYDYDEDMNPLFSVTRLPTQGDIAGGAVNDVQDPNKGFFKISLPNQSDAPNGIVKRGISVTLGQPVWTERPAFALDENRSLAADTAFVPALDVTPAGALAPNGPASLRNFRALTCKAGSTDGATCGLTLQRLSPDRAPAFAANKVELDLASNSSYGFFAEPVDIETVVVKAPGDTSASGGLDVRLADGKVDPHPILGSGLGLPWYSPIVIMQRLPAAESVAIETAARIPPVLLVGSVLLGDDDLPTKSSYLQSGAPIAIPPIAAVELIPGRADCRVPYFPPGTSGIVTAGLLGNCDELPTGHYAVNVLGGIAGGMPGPSASFPTKSESPLAVVGGGYSGQSWSVPNELGNPLQVGAANVIESQGTAGSFVIHDPSDGKAACSSGTFAGICANGPEFTENAVGVDSTSCLASDCCAFVTHLCRVPTCEKVATADGKIAASPTKIVSTDANGGKVPDCVPFAMPAQCCPGM